MVATALVAHSVTERRLEHTAVDRFLTRPGLARRNVDQVRALAGERLADLDRVVGRDAVVAGPVGCRDATDIGRSPGHAARIAREDFERIAQAAFEAPAIFVGAPVGAA